MCPFLSQVKCSLLWILLNLYQSSKALIGQSPIKSVFLPSIYSTYCTSVSVLFSLSLLLISPLLLVSVFPLGFSGSSTPSDRWGAPLTPTSGIWITAVMTGPSGANMPQRRFNRPEWRSRYRQCHPSEAGGARRRRDNNWLYISHCRINSGIISASLSDAQKSKWAGFALKGQDIWQART